MSTGKQTEQTQRGSFLLNSTLICTSAAGVLGFAAKCFGYELVPEWSPLTEAAAMAGGGTLGGLVVGSIGEAVRSRLTQVPNLSSNDAALR